MDADIMKRKSSPKPVTRPADPFAIPRAEWPREEEFIGIINSVLARETTPPERQASEASEPPTDYLKTLVSIATNTWRAKTKMVDASTGQIREDLRRIDRHIEAIYRALAGAGISVRDHTGDPYDEGQPMKVVASKPVPGLARKYVSETLLPSIFWNNRLLQNGEIEIAIPSAPNTPA